MGSRRRTVVMLTYGAAMDQPVLYLATPAYGGLVTTRYLTSLLAAKGRLDRLGIGVAVDAIAGESLITRARNACAARFLAASLAGRPFTHLVFIDADVGFPEWAIERLLGLGEPVVAAAYPLKRVGWSRLAELAQAGTLAGRTAAEIEALACDYALRLAVPSEVRDDFVSVLSAGTGFMCVARAAIEELGAAATPYVNDVAGYEIPAPGTELDGELRFRALFEAGVDAESGTYLSEDYAFCKRWRALGGKIWVDLRTPLTHVGSHAHEGNVATWLESVGAIARI